MPDAANATSPVAPAQRIQAIDVCRGFALLGILLVNIQFFGEPFGSWMHWDHSDEPLLDRSLHWFTTVFCEGKFYPLFSMLFGMGLALQFGRAGPGAGGFTARYLRRIGLLLLMGLAHALLMWYGDILFLYSFCAFALLMCIRARARTLLIIACVIVGISAPLMGGFSMLNAFKPETPAAETASAEATPVDEVDAASAEAAPEQTPLQELFAGFERYGSNASPDQAWWMAAEERAYRDGPWLQSFGFRAMSWAFIMLISLFGFGWHAMAMFFLGAALLKMGLFEERRRPWAARFVMVGGFVGLPMVIASLWARDHAPQLLGLFVWGATPPIAGPLMSLGYMGAIILLVGRARGAGRVIAGAIANAGRMALTNYLLQTTIATFIFYHWGLAMFGQTTHAERVGLALAIWTAEVAVSSVWLRVFRFGPMEWLWRTGTYLRLQPMLRRAGDA